MSKYICYCVGGTGTRVAEVTQYLMSVNLLATGDKIDFIVVDKDKDCGGTKTAEGAMARYNWLYNFMQKGGNQRSFARTGTELISWSFDEAIKKITGEKANASLKDSLNATQSAEDKAILDALYSDSEQDQQTSRGFYGHASIGALIFNYMTSLAGADALAQPVIDAVNAIQNDDKVKVFIVGSIFGGTGAAVFSNLASFLRDKANEINCGKRLLISGALLLPYFSVPVKGGAENNEQIDLTVVSNEFMAKSKVALFHYGEEERLIKKTDNNVAGENSSWVFDTLYVMGYTPHHCTSTVYADGGDKQINHFDLVDLLAAHSAFDFFNSSFTSNAPIDNQRSNICLYQALTGKGDMATLTWDNIPIELKGAFIQMTRFSSYVITCLHSIFKLSVEDAKAASKNTMAKDLYGAKFMGAHKASDEQYAQMGVYIQGVYDFCSRFINFIYDLTFCGKDWSSKSGTFMGSYNFFNRQYIERLKGASNILDNCTTPSDRENARIICAGLTSNEELVPGSGVYIDNLNIQNELAKFFERKKYADVDTSERRVADYLDKLYLLCQ